MFRDGSHQAQASLGTNLRSAMVYSYDFWGFLGFIHAHLEQALPPRTVKSEVVTPRIVKSEAVAPRIVKSEATAPHIVKSEAMAEKENGGPHLAIGRDGHAMLVGATKLDTTSTLIDL